MKNLADDPDYASIKKQLAEQLDAWIEATHDSAPADLSKDTFDRLTGKSLLKGKERREAARGTPAGADRDASHINAPGPR
jgi:hypothetical protein